MIHDILSVNWIDLKLFYYNFRSQKVNWRNNDFFKKKFFSACILMRDRQNYRTRNSTARKKGL